MSLALIVYLAGIVNDLKEGLVMISCVIAVYCALVALSSDKITKSMKWVWTGCVIALFLAALIPNKETLYTMVAASTIQDIATSPKVQELGGKSLDVINKVMDDYLKDVNLKETKEPKAQQEK